MKKFKNIYRIPSARLQNWDYGWNAAYFVTVCTKQRECYFGNIVQDEMQLSNVGILADVFWHEIKHHSTNVELDSFVVMPNHVHGILFLGGDDNDNCANHDNGRNHVETRHALSLQAQPHPSSQPKPQTIGQKRFQNQGKNTLSSIVGSYKAAVTRHAHRLRYSFAWQPSFHDHIIRNEISYQQIAQYTINNARNWKKDRFYIP